MQAGTSAEKGRAVREGRRRAHTQGHRHASIELDRVTFATVTAPEGHAVQEMLASDGL